MIYICFFLSVVASMIIGCYLGGWRSKSFLKGYVVSYLGRESKPKVQPAIEIHRYSKDLFPEIGDIDDADWIVILHDTEEYWTADSIALTLDSKSHPRIFTVRGNTVVWTCCHS